MRIKNIYGIRTKYKQTYIYIQCKLFSYLPSVGLAQARPNNITEFHIEVGWALGLIL